MTTVIKIDNLWKEYRLGVIGHGTLTKDLQSWWARKCGKDDPNSKIPIIAGQERQIEGDRFWALRGIDFEVKQGQILGIIGKNGAGKSTLLKIMSRVTAPSRGNIKVKGRIASLLEVGTGFHPELTGRENIFLNGAILGMSKLEIRRKLDEIVDFSGIESFLDTPVKRYSSGMYVRLAFAVAAHLEPEVMIVDEVLAVGDAEFQKKCLGKMNDIAGEGRTILFVSHNMISIERLCNLVVIIDSGKISKKGEPTSIIDGYLKSQQERITRDLSNRTDRKGSGEIRIDKFELRNKYDDVVSSIRSSEKAKIRFYYRKISRSPIKDFRVGCVIYNNSNPLLLLDSSIVSDQKLTIDDSGYFEFCIDNMPLSRGKYTVSLFVGKGVSPIDWIENACEIYVEDGFFYRTNRLYPHESWAGKTVLVNHTFIHG